MVGSALRFRTSQASWVNEGCQYTPYRADLDDKPLGRGARVRAGGEPRRRTNHNLHPMPGDPVQRLLVAAKLGTYFRPHRHEICWECAIVLQGDAADEELLLEENIDSADVFAALTNYDEANVMAAMLASTTWLEPLVNDSPRAASSRASGES